MLLKRVVTALVLFLLVVGVLFNGGPGAWAVLAVIVMSLALREWARLIDRQYPGPILLCALLAFCYYRYRIGAVAAPGWLVPLLLLSVLNWVRVAVPAVLRAQAPARPSMMLACTSMLALWVSLLELRMASPMILLSAMALIWLADIGAYFAGRRFGRRKLAPQVSPGKSWEGVWGGMALCLVTAFLVATLRPDIGVYPIYSSVIALNLGAFLTGAFLIALVMISVMGDLFESLLKRHAGVKDSSRLLPGHGGVFDRIDALVPAMPLCLLVWLLAQP